jgi:hypothetical protein
MALERYGGILAMLARNLQPAKLFIHLSRRSNRFSVRGCQ